MTTTKKLEVNVNDNPPSVTVYNEELGRSVVRDATEDEILDYYRSEIDHLEWNTTGRGTPTVKTRGIDEPWRMPTFHEMRAKELVNRHRGIETTLESIEEEMLNSDREEESIEIVGGYPPTTFEQALDVVFGKMREVMIHRQCKYGSENIAEFGEVGAFMRSRDKSNRIKNAYFDEKGNVRPVPIDDHSDDSLDDAWLDLGNYGAIGLMLRMGIWGLPLMEDS